MATKLTQAFSFVKLRDFRVRFVQRFPLLVFTLLVVGTPYAVLLPLLAAGVDQEQLKPLKLPLALTPLAYAWLVVSMADGEQGVRRLFGKLWTPRAHWSWQVLAIAIFLAIAFTALGIRYWSDGFFPPRSEFGSLGTIVVWSLPLLLFPGITEEFAWRGLLQAGLQKHLHWWWASLSVGLVWGSWHGFDFLLGNWTFSWTTFGGYPLFIISNSIIIGWLFKCSGESVWVAMLAHFGSNCVNFFTPVFEEYHGSALPAVLYIGGLCSVACLLPLVRLRCARR